MSREEMMADAEGLAPGDALAKYGMMDRGARLALEAVPSHLQAGLVRYYLFGVVPGAHLRASLANDLAAAVATADIQSLSGMHLTTGFVQALPLCSRGTYAAVSVWEDRGGLLAYEDPAASGSEPGSGGGFGGGFGGAVGSEGAAGALPVTRTALAFGNEDADFARARETAVHLRRPAARSAKA